MRRGPTLVLVLSALLFAALGAWFLISPSGPAASVGLVLDRADARIEVRAIYGGLELGVALFQLICLATGRVREGLLAGACLLLGAAVGRAVGIALEGQIPGLTGALLATEIGGGLLCLLALRWTHAAFDPGSPASQRVFHDESKGG